MRAVPTIGHASVVAAGVAALGLAGHVDGGRAAAGARPAAPRVTMITDSVGGVLFWATKEREQLAQGLDFRLETATCRRLVSTGCFAYGQVPPSALDTARALGSDLGSVVVVDVGYNDLAAGYGDGLDAVMQALVGAGVEHVLWMTLYEGQPAWAAINDQIRAAAQRWPQLTVADWAPVIENEPGWVVDNAHMNESGAAGLVRFLRPLVLDACGVACAPAPVATMLPATVKGHRALLRWRGDDATRAFDVALRRAGGPWRPVAVAPTARSVLVDGEHGALLEARVRGRDAAGVIGPWSRPRAFRL